MYARVPLRLAALVAAAAAAAFALAPTKYALYAESHYANKGVSQACKGSG